MSEHQDGRDPHSGKFVAGNTVALRHGGRRRPLSPQEARTSELFARWAADLGGLDALSVGQQEVLAGIVASVFVRATAERYLAQSRAPLTSDKAKRALEVFFRADDAVRRGASLLGLERKAKPADLDLATYLQHADEGERGGKP
jgi:hypothetical protein